jgi:hypothetical protein
MAQGSYLRTFALELKEQRAQTISVCSVLREKSKHEPLSQEIYANVPF